MPTPVTDLCAHGEFRKILCCICHRQWSEQLVAARLRSEQRSHGSLCPRCLDRTPLDAALWITEFGRGLTTAVGQLGESLKEPARSSRLPRSVEEYRERIIGATETTAHLRALTKALRSELPALRERIEQTRLSLGRICQETSHRIQESQQRRRLDADSKQASRLRTLADSLESETDRAGELLLLADELSGLEHWPTTVSEMISLERETVARQFFRPLSDADLATIVDNRYRLFLHQHA